MKKNSELIDAKSHNYKYRTKMLSIFFCLAKNIERAQNTTATL